MDYIIKTAHKTSYTTVDNTFIYDSRLSWKAKGIIVALMSFPSETRFKIKDLVVLAKDGRDALYKGIKELTEFGYCRCEECRSEDGKISGYAYRVSDKPLTENPYTENPNTEKESEKERKKESNIKKELKKEEKERDTNSAREIFPIENPPIKEKKIKFAEFVEMYQREYDKLCGQYGRRGVDEMISILDNAKGAKGYKYKSDYRAILVWVIDEYKKRHQQVEEKGTNASTLFY